MSGITRVHVANPGPLGTVAAAPPVHADGPGDAPGLQRPPPPEAHPGAPSCYSCGDQGGCPRCDGAGTLGGDVDAAGRVSCPACHGSGLCPGCDRPVREGSS